MKRTPRDGQSQPVLLGRELGRGGEGAVYEMPAQPGFVAKLYHQPPDAAKQAKLKLMAEAIDSPLRDYAAWPEDTLHDDSGAVIGFTMQRIEKRVPIHMLYSPAQRRETFPNVRFDFLVFVARNIAAAFETLHAHGHVLGDVNQGNVLVGEDSRVILIDCDSFQIQVGDALHRCEVGVAHFTPPELQTVASFEDITRTPNHDAFGLALLIFHLLMGGRHPYSGVPLAAHVGESLEADIRENRYAYAADAAKRLIAPPPKSVPIQSLPPEIVALFAQAFAERSVASRPSAKAWVTALDALRKRLKQCAKHALHVHAAHLPECIWCQLERKHLQFFGAIRRAPPQLPRSADAAQAKATPDFAAMEAAIASMSTPRPVLVPLLPALPPPPDLIDVEGRAVGQGMLFGVPPAIIGAASAAKVLATPAMLAGAMLGAGIPVAIIAAVVAWRFHTKRANAYREAHARFRVLYEAVHDRVDEVNEAAGVGLIEEWRKAEQQLRAFRAKDASALANFKLDAAESGLRKHLQNQLIERWREPQVSLSERVRLRGAGIETAADFDKPKLAKLHLLSDGARAALIAWKQGLISEYRSKQPAGTPDLAQFTKLRSIQRKDLEQRLVDAFMKIQKCQKQGSLVLQARRNQLAELERDLRAQHRSCLDLAKGLPKIERQPSPPPF